MVGPFAGTLQTLRTGIRRGYLESGPISRSCGECAHMQAFREIRLDGIGGTHFTPPKKSRRSDAAGAVPVQGHGQGLTLRPRGTRPPGL